MKQRSQDRSWAQSIWNPVGRGGGGGGEWSGFERGIVRVRAIVRINKECTTVLPTKGGNMDKLGILFHIQ